jgi:hypothetical protein
MRDYSLQTVKSRAAKVGDKLTTRNFGTGTRGFAASEDASIAVCVLPGTELSLFRRRSLSIDRFVHLAQKLVKHKTAIFRQVNKQKIAAHHDALEFPNGQVVLLTFLCEGQQATVLQLPTEPKTGRDLEKQKRAAYVG